MPKLEQIISRELVDMFGICLVVHEKTLYKSEEFKIDLSVHFNRLEVLDNCMKMHVLAETTKQVFNF